MEEYAIELKDIVKRFPGIIANDHISLRIKKGEIHALLGENGAGKSTLMSILFGMYQPDEGEIWLNGKRVTISSPREANAYGIGMVHQHFKLVQEFTVLENIILGVETVKRGLLHMENARKKVMGLSERYGLKVDVDAKVSEISVGMQQRVEILKMLYRENDILIFDEPTAVLTPQEIEELIRIIRGLADEGKSIIFITHKLNEIKALCDQCTVLRKGAYIATVSVADTSKEHMAELMVARKMSTAREKKPYNPGATVLEVKGLTLRAGKQDKPVLDNISFSIHHGEILCIAGIDGNGQKELVEVITGLLPGATGEILVHGEDISQKSIRYRNTHGISFIPEDRHKYGLVLDYNLQENLALKRYFSPQLKRKGFIDVEARATFSEKLIQQYDIRCANGGETMVRSMSGGNQQKAIIARELELGQDILIAMQPTRGLDVGAIEGIHKNLVEQRDGGTSVLLVSLELEEVFSVSDRILVLYEGQIVGEFFPGDITPEEIGLYMSGAKRRQAG